MYYRAAPSVRLVGDNKKYPVARSQCRAIFVLRSNIARAAFSYTGNPPGAGGIQDLTEISPPLTVVKVAAPGPYTGRACYSDFGVDAVTVIVLWVTPPPTGTLLWYRPCPPWRGFICGSE